MSDQGQKKDQNKLPAMSDFMNNENPLDIGKDNPEEEAEAEEEEEEEEVPKQKTRKLKNSPDVGPVVRVHKENGKFKKSIPIQLQGLTSMMLPPLTKRRTAMYEVLGKDQKDPLTGELIDIPPPIIIPASYVIYDPFDDDVLKRHKTLKNVTRFENRNIGGVNVPHEVIEDIVFDAGIKVVPIERQYLLYVLLELHPLNASNKWRDKNQAPAFKRVDVDQRKWGSSNSGLNLAYEAETAVLKLTKPEDIIAYAHTAGISTANRILDNDREGCVKYDLRVFARNDPRGFFKLNKGVEQAIRISVLDADELGLIEYTIDNRCWTFSTDGEHICQLIPGEDPIKGLVKMLQKPEYSKHYEVLQNQLNYWD